MMFVLATDDKIPDGIMHEDENGRLTIGPKIYTWKTTQKSYICSKCNKSINKTTESITYNYCPYCATRMNHMIFSDKQFDY